MCEHPEVMWLLAKGRQIDELERVEKYRLVKSISAEDVGLWERFISRVGDALIAVGKRLRMREVPKATVHA